MVTAMVFAILVALLAAAYWVHSQLDELLGRFECAIGPHVPRVTQKFTAGLEAAKGYVQPRAVGWARRLALGCVAHAAVFFGAATIVAVVRPAPQEVSYSTVAKREDATWFQHGAAYFGYGSGWLVQETRPGFFYSKARLTDGSTLVGLPGVQQWYRL